MPRLIHNHQKRKLNNPKDKLKGTCCICSNPAHGWFNKKKYCKKCFYLKRTLKSTDKELIILYR